MLDANLNRSREGLRVCEEVTRFCLDNPALTAALKKVRHDISETLKRMPVSSAEWMASRDVRSDVGKGPSRLEQGRGDAPALFAANIQRAKEALRVLEESSKIIDLAASAAFKKTRFKVYAIEKRALPKLETLRDYGPERPKGEGDHRGRARRGARWGRSRSASR